MTSSLKLFLILYYIKQIDSKLPCVCSVIDHRERQNVVRTKKLAHEAQPSVSLMFCIHLSRNLFVKWTEEAWSELSNDVNA